jgi:hypothetical protein
VWLPHGNAGLGEYLFFYFHLILMMLPADCGWLTGPPEVAELLAACRHSGHKLRTHHASRVFALKPLSSQGKLNDVDDDDVILLGG